jgi:hypothetical protein
MYQKKNICKYLNISEGCGNEKVVAERDTLQYAIEEKLF